MRWLMVFLLAALAMGCASLPDYELLHRTAEVRGAPRVIGEDGLLSRQQGAAVLRKLKEGEGVLHKHLTFMEAISDIPLVVGNSVRLLIDGPATYRSMYRAISSARNHINLETYILADDEAGNKMADLLIEKQSKGVQVNLIYDGVGSIKTPASFFENLSKKGVAVCQFNSVNLLKGNVLRLNHRDHRKILVVDGTTAFTGGINISNVYTSSSSRRRPKNDVTDGWRDTHIEIQGPAVAELQKLFFTTWKKQDCAPLAEKKYLPVAERQGDKVVRVIGTSPDDPINLIYVDLLSAIVHAQQSIYLTIAYFVPDPQIIEALKQAAKRGVDVKVVLPSFSDFWIVFHAGRSHYSELLEADIKVYERQDAMLHAKTAVIDGVWSTVGSTNMDWRSFLHNDEVNAIVLGEDFAKQMNDMFKADLANSKPVDPQQWQRRAIPERAKELLARLWAYWL
ncbi:MAG: cardiolipin synthase [Burkholderiales bacterium]|nr:cardiolipin synthase [Burkholderiales bacterium]